VFAFVQRFPRFEDALADLDDCLSLVHLFATLPAVRAVKAARTSAARRLAQEWQYFIARTHALRRVFFRCVRPSPVLVR